MENVNTSDSQVEEQIKALASENARLKSSLESTLNMFRFTLGIAYNAHPDNDKIKGMVDSLYRLGDENGR